MFPAADHLTPWQAFWTVGWAGHAGSKVDAWLTSSAAQIGQVMLSLPRAVYLTSAAAGLPLMIVSLFPAFSSFMSCCCAVRTDLMPAYGCTVSASASVCEPLTAVKFRNSRVIMSAGHTHHPHH